MDAVGGLSFVQIVLSDLQCRQANSIPILAIPAPGVDRMIAVLYATLHVYQDTGYVGTTSLGLKYSRTMDGNSVGQNAIVTFAQFLTGTVPQNRWSFSSALDTFVDLNVPPTNLGSPINKAIMLHASGDTTPALANTIATIRIMFVVIDAI